jgi:hypothetical protein
MSGLLDLPLGGVLSFVLRNWHWVAAGATVVTGGGAALLGGPLLIFLRANWQWVLPTVLLVVALIWAAVAQIGWERCTASAAHRIAEEQQKVLAQKEADRQLMNQILSERDERDARVGTKVVTIVQRINNAEATDVCSGVAAMRAADDGLLELGFPREAGPAVRPNAQGAGAAGRGAARR